MKTILYIPISLTRHLRWAIKSKNIKGVKELINEAIDWYDPDKLGLPLFYDKQRRSSRVIQLDLSKEKQDKLNDLDKRFELDGVNRVISNIVELYLKENEVKIFSKRIECERVYDVRFTEDLIKFIQSCSGDNVSKGVTDILAWYHNNGLYKTKFLVTWKESGARRTKTKVYLSKKSRETLNIICNHMKATPQMVIIDAVGDYKEAFNEPQF